MPKAAAKAIETKGNLTITIRKDATVLIEDKAVPLTVLSKEIVEAVADGKKGVLIRADQAVPYGAVVKVLDITRKSGVQDVGLITELDEEARKR